MPYLIYVTPTAIRDLEAAIDYYNEQAEGLGARFSDLVQEYFNRIAITPTASAVRYKNIRCKPLATFPYLIFYTIDEAAKTVNILRIFHSHQEPFW